MNYNIFIAKNKVFEFYIQNRCINFNTNELLLYSYSKLISTHLAKE